MSDDIGIIIFAAKLKNNSTQHHTKKLCRSLSGHGAPIFTPYGFN